MSGGLFCHRKPPPPTEILLLAAALALLGELDQARAAAQAGFPPSLANLALMYASGDGVAQDMAQSLAYGRQAAEADVFGLADASSTAAPHRWFARAWNWWRQQVAAHNRDVLMHPTVQRW